MTLFESKPYDPIAARKRRNRIIAIVAIVAVCAILAGISAIIPRSAVNHFFAALQQQSYEQAYAIWNDYPLEAASPEIFAVWLSGLHEGLGTERRVGHCQELPH